MTGPTVVDLGQLPRVGDGWTFLHAEHVRVERADYAIELVDVRGRVAVPSAALSVLLLGPGTTISHAAIAALAEVGCSVAWVGEGGVRFYAAGIGETRRSHHIEAQARAWAVDAEHEAVVRRMYLHRFPEDLPPDLTIEQIRGREGVRVREAYARWSRETGVRWAGRSYRRDDWTNADPINRALSAANACLYGLCHAAIVSVGFSPALGFIHVGKQLSFVYDIADLYKADTTIPAAFVAVAESPLELETRVRRRRRTLFREARILERIIPDMQTFFGLRPDPVRVVDHGAIAEEVGRGLEPGELWNSGGARIAGGRSFAPAKTKPNPEEAARLANEDDAAFWAAVADEADG